MAHVPELNVIDAGKEEITFGAAVTYARAMPALIEAFPALRTYLARLGSRQIRTLGTIGGNLGNASPIGDMPPVLLALETRVKLVSVARHAGAAARRVLHRLPQDGAGARRSDPEPDPAGACGQGESFHCDKVSKRRDQDISTVAGAYRLRIKNGRIEDVRLAFGGMAATPRRASHAEAALLKDGFEAARAALAKDFQPLDDWRGTAAYRLQVATNLLRRLELRLADPRGRSRSRRCERRRPYLAAPRFRR